MSLAAYTPETDTVEIGRPKEGQPATLLTLYGLTLADFTGMIANHLADIEAIYNLWTKDKARIMKAGSLDAFLIALCRDSPDIVAEVISRGCREPELIDKAKQLPFSIQVVALSKIAKLTFEEAGGLPQLQAALTTLLTQSLSGNGSGLATPQNPGQSSTSIGDAVETLHS